MYLIIDTETTNFPSKTLPLDHPNQGRIIQLAALVLDEEFKEINSFYSLIKLESHIIMSEGAFNAHGIDIERARKYGVSIDVALNVLNEFRNQCEFRVAHNIKFDSSLIENEIAIRGTFNGSKTVSDYCTMLASTELCQLPSKRGGYKWPKLEEALNILLGESLNGSAHDALADVRGCAKLLKYLKSSQVLV